MLKWLPRRWRRNLGVEREHGPIIVQGRQLRCTVCSNDTFWAKQIQLHTAIMTFMNLDAWNRLADCAICERCGYIHWFIAPETADRSSEGEGKDAP